MKRAFLFSFLTFFIFVAEIHAQWSQVFTVAPIHYPQYGGGVYFSKGGLWLVSPGDNIPIKFYSSLDTGKTWTLHTIANSNSSVGGNSIRFIDGLNGVMSLYGSSEAEITSDAGQTWNLIIGGAFDMAFLGSSNRILIAFTSPDFIIPYPFTSASSTPVPGGGSLSFAITPKGTVFTGHDPMQMSTDFGTTWQRRGRYDLDGWSMTTGKLCDDSTIYIVNEWDRKIPPHCEIYVSSDAGNSFTTKLPNSQYGYLSGSIEASKHAVFCATTQGVLRSTDKGQTWAGIGGPESPFKDVRSIAVINDDIIFALDSLGILWRTDNCGGFPIKAPPPPMPQIASIPAKASSCDSGKASASLMHTYCDALTVTDATLVGTDASYFTLLPQALPISLGNGAKVLFNLGFNPKKQVRAFSAQIHVKGFYIFEYEDTVRIDTLIPVTATSTPVAPIITASPSTFIFDTVSTCKPPVDTTVTLINKGCDTLTITQGPGLLPPEFTVVSLLNLPIKIPPDSSLTVTFRFTPSGAGTFSVNPKFTAVQQGLSQDITLYLEGSGKQEGGVFSYSPKAFNFQSLSICAHDSASGFVTNIGCDSLRLDPSAIFGDPDYTFSALSQLPALKPSDTMKYEVYLDPAQKGIRNGYLVFTSNDKISTRHDTVHFTVTVTDGTRILSSSLATADFGSVSVCDERDSLLTLSNTGCDTLVITGYGLSGSGFGTDSKFPIMILPHTDTTIHIFTLLDTAGGKSITTGTLTFNSNSDNTLAPITLRRTFIASARRDLGLYLDGTAKAGYDQNIVTYDIKESPGKSFSGAGIKQITFDLNYNTDLLDFTQGVSSNVTSSDGKSFTISGNPIAAGPNGILATIGFTVYLTKDSTTSINLINVKIDTVSLPCTVTTFSDSGSATFDYNFLCGERSIAGFLGGVMPMRIVALRPNPAQDELQIDLQSAVKQDAQVEILNALGAKVYSDIKNVASGTSSIHLDTRSLSSGVYLVRVGGASQSFVKVK